jgi:SprT protein
MTTITPIGSSRQQQVIAETSAYISQAGRIYRRRFKPVEILFDLKGTASGMFCATGSRTVIRYNPYIFAKHFTYSLANTVPHEAAHYIVHCMHGSGKVRPHGDEWKDLMRLLGVEPRRTCRLDLEGIPMRRQRRHAYSCSCGTHQVSSVRHNRIQNGSARYFCRTCRDELQVSSRD